MESVPLLDLANSVPGWPSNDADLISASGKIARFAQFPFVAILSRRNGVAGDRVGYLWTGETGGTPPINGDLLGDFVKRQLSHLALAPGELRSVQLSREGTAITALRENPHLTFARICAAPPTSGPNTGDGSPGPTNPVDYGCLLVATPMPLDSNGKLNLAAAILVLRHLAEARQFETAISLRNQFLSIASHELKTPLTSIYGMLQLQERMMRVKKEDDSVLQRDKLQGYFKMVIRQVERLNELIDGLLNVSRIQSGRFMVDPSDADVSVILDEVIQSRLNLIATEAGVRLNVEAPESLPAWVDSVRFEEVITNLVMNAIRFSPEGGAVWIKMRDEGGSFRLIVRDQGPSVPPDDRERIFQPFERAQRTARLGGLGLGLYISRQIAQFHGGNVNLAESIPGKGNVFEATFPVRNINLISA